VLGLLCANIAACGSAARAEVLNIHYISAAAANEAVLEAVLACAKKGYAVAATVVDKGALRIAALRGDNAGAHTSDVSWGKAYGAVSFAPIYGLADSGAVGKLKIPTDGSSYQIPDHMVLRGGGVTIKYGNEVVGAIGVSGSPGADFDEECARAGYEKIKASFN
jgi:uncharacterized protein GlcG (DUF336 family)